MDPRMLAVGGNIIGSFLLGQQQREARLEDQKFKHQQLKMMMDAQKIKDAKEERTAAAEERKSAIRQQMIQLELGKALGVSPEYGGVSGGSGLNFGETFGKDSTAAQTAQNQPSTKKLIDILSENQLLAIALKEETGTDYPAAVEARRKAQADANQQKYNSQNLLIRAGAGAYVDEQDANGVVRPVFRLTNPTAAQMLLNGGQQGMPSQPPTMGARPGLGATPPALGGIKSIPKPETREEIKNGVTYSYEVNPYNMQEVPGTRRVKEEQKPMVGENAGKVGMLQSGLNALNEAKNIIMPNGKVDEDTYKVLAQASVNMPWSKGRQYNSLIMDTIEGKLRLESGAAVPEDEVKRIAMRFKPQMGDSPEQIKQKLDRLEAFSRGTVELLDPNKKYGRSEQFRTENGKQYVVTPNMSLTADKAKEYLTMAGGNADKARELAKKDGWEF